MHRARRKKRGFRAWLRLHVRARYRRIEIADKLDKIWPPKYRKLRAAHNRNAVEEV